MMHAVPAAVAAAAIDRSSRRRPSRGARLGNGAAPAVLLDPAALLRDLCDAMFIIGHDGERVHAEIAMTFDLYGRLVQLWGDLCEPPALHLAD